MDVGPAAAPKAANGLTTVVDTIVAPKDAFDRLREAPTWGYAALVIVVLTFISAILAQPANTHVGVAMIQHMLANNPSMASMSDAEKQKMLGDAAHPPAWRMVLNPLLGLLGTALVFLCNTLFLLIGNATGRGSASFKSLWAASVNIGVPTVGIGTLLVSIVELIRGPDSFNTMGDMFHAVPSLAWIAPGVGGFTGAMLGAISIFVLWGFALNVLALRHTAQVKNAVAWIVPATVTILGALLTGFFISFAQKFT